jgi:hypothetical protein
MLEANQPLAEAETLIAQRKSDRVFAKTKLERGQQLVEKAALTTQVFDQRVAKAETMRAAVLAAKAEHEQAQFDDQDRLGRGGRIELILADLEQISPDSAGPFTCFDPVGFAIFATAGTEQRRPGLKTARLIRRLCLQSSEAGQSRDRS